LNSLYNYQLREKENNRLKIENKEKQNLIIYIISIGLFIIASLFAYLQRNKRKKQLLKIQLKNLRQLKEEQYKKSSLFIEENKRKIEELEQKLQEADQTNHILRTQLKEQIELTLYTNKQAEIELTRRKQSNSTLLESEIYKYIQKQLTTKTNKKLLSNNDWKELEKVINNTYEGFSKNLRNYYDLNEHEYSVCLLIKINIPPIDIAKLTNHSKEAITSTRRRLYEKVFGKKGSPKDWDEFILSL
jgi:DNA-binding CsgD family transcriptional regulator